MRRRILAVFLLALALAAGAQAEVKESLDYVLTELFGKDVWTGFCHAERDEAGIVTIAYNNPLERHWVRSSYDFQTLEWEWKSMSRQATAVAKFDGRTLSYTGQMKGKPHAESRELGETPWYQLPDFALMKVSTMKEGDTLTFWIIVPDDLSMRKLRGRNAGPETFTLGPREVPAVRVVLSAAGVPEWLWKNEYWFTPSGEYLGFRGRRGGPVAPMGTIVRQGY